MYGFVYALVDRFLSAAILLIVLAVGSLWPAYTITRDFKDLMD